MTDPNATPTGHEPHSSPGVRRTYAVRATTSAGAASIGAAALGALALGAFAIGAVAVGRLAIGRLSLRHGYVRELRVGRLTFDELKIGRLVRD